MLANIKATSPKLIAVSALMRMEVAFDLVCPITNLQAAGLPASTLLCAPVQE